METILENDKFIVHVLEFPSHCRTILFLDKTKKFVRLPDSIIVTAYDKELKYIDKGLLLSKDLNYHLNLWSHVCTNGQIFNNIIEYANWYWNSSFDKRLYISKYSVVVDLNFLKCTPIFDIVGLGYILAKKYNPDKITKNKIKFSKHIKKCLICKEQELL